MIKEAEAKVEAKVEQQKIETARQMKIDGMAQELIAKYTGLTEEEIKEL